MNVLILGGNSDIGLAIARRFAKEESANIILASRNEEELKRNAADLSITHNIRVETCHFDARDYSTHHEFYKDLPFKPDGLVLAFGYNGDQKKAETDQEELRKIVETNYLGAATMLEVIAIDFSKRSNSENPKPFVIGISSAAGERGRMGNYIYGSAKAGLTTLLSGLRQRFNEKEVQVITLKPGFVDTKMTRGKDLPGLLLLSPRQVAQKTYRAYKTEKPVTYITWYWWAIMQAIKLIPESIFKHLKF